MKRTLSFILTLVMIIGIITSVPVTVLAGESGECGENLTWTLSNNGELLTISGTGDMEDFIPYSYAPWHYCCANIKRIVIKPGVTSIGEYAFMGCNITSITIPDSVKSIGYEAFRICKSLEEVTIGNGVKFIGDEAFEECTSLSSITLHNGVLTIGDKAFYECTSLTSITIPDSVETIGKEAFYNCESLTDVTIGKSVKSIDDSAFGYCGDINNVYMKDITAWCGINFVDIESNPMYFAENLYLNGELVTDVVIPDGVTRIGSCAFYNCESLRSITIPGSVTDIGQNAFWACKNLTHVNVSDIAAWCSISFEDYNSNPLKEYGNLYLNGELVTDVVIPYGITSIGDYAFCEYQSLTSIVIPDSVTNIGDWAFYNCSNLTDFTIPNGVTSIGESSFRDCTSLTSIVIPDSVTSIGAAAFNGCRRLASIVIPDSVTSIGEVAFYDTSYYNNSKNWDNDILYIGNHLIKVKYTFSGEFEFREGTKTISGSAFSDCSQLTKVHIPEGIRSIGNYAFYYCTSLTSVTIPSTVTEIGLSNFYNCTSLESINISNGVTSVGEYSFYNCTSLTSITLPESVTSIGDYAFYDCTNISSVTILGKVTSIGESAFLECINLSSITFPDSLISIGMDAFYGCVSLTSVIIPKRVESIGSGAFFDCTNISSITIPDTAIKLNDWTFRGTAYYNDTNNWENGVLYIGNYLLAVDEDFSDDLEIKDGTKVVAAGVLGYVNSGTIKIPESVVYVGSNCFSQTWRLRYIYYGGSKQQWDELMKNSSERDYRYVKIHYNSMDHIAGDWVVTEVATCTDRGWHVSYCIACGEFTGSEPIPEKGHKSSTWIVDKKATVNSAGKKHKECTRCGEVLKTETIKQLKCSKPKLTKIENTADGVKITWSKVSGADKYAVYRKTGGGSYSEITAAKGNSKVTYTDKSAKSGKKYYYYIKAINEAGKSDASSSKSIFYLADTTLSTPKNTEEGITLSWKKVTGAEGYVVYRKTGSGKYEKYATVKGNSKVTYTDKSVKSGKKYYYYVKAINEASSSVASNTKSILCLADTTLKTPSSTKSGVKLTWSKVTGAEGYMVYRKTGSGSYSKIATVKGNSKVTYTDKKAKKGKTYTYKIKAYNSKTTSAYSNAKKIKDKY